MCSRIGPLVTAVLLAQLVDVPTARANPWQNRDTVTVTTDEQLRRITGQRIPPGATLLLAPGTYSGDLSLHELRGTEGKPITIAAADPKRPPVISGGGACLHLVSPAYVEIRDIVFEHASINTINIDDGGAPDRPAVGVRLKNLVIRDMRVARGNNDGLKLSGLSDFRVENCKISGWGAGGSAIDMVGCRGGSIVGCTFRQDDPGTGSGVQAKGGSRDVTLDRCAFQNAGQRAVNIGGSTGLEYFRPQSPRPNYEAKDVTVRRCTFRGSMAPVSFVGIDGAVVEDCVIYRPARWVVRILQENQEPSFVPSRGGVFRRNVVAFRSDELRTAVNVGDGTAPETFTFEANEWYCLDAPARSKPQLPTPEKNGVYGREPQFKDPERGDFTRRTSPRPRR
jgi:hypothetical protein